MISRPILTGLLAGTCVASAPALAAQQITLVACAPGYPGTTDDAQPTMDELARGVTRAAGWNDERVAAVYHPTVEGGLEALSAERAGLALAPLPFYLEQRERLGLEPLLSVAQTAGTAEVWSVVAKRGTVAGPGALAGWELAGMPGYSSRFVRRVALAEWGELPADVRIRFNPRVLSVLREAARGEKVAAILDRAQTEALASLPFADDLEVVARSRPLVGTVLCRVRGRLSDATADELKDAFLELERLEDGRALLDTLRIRRFEVLDTEELSRIERTFAGARERAR
jgi:ABC-type phosphate/phosphonate transport system substrate-binding protein